MDWKEKLKELLEPYGEVFEESGGLVFEFGDDEGEFTDRLAFVVENPGEWPLVEVSVKAIADLTDHDVPGRNIFAFGVVPEFNGEIIELRILNGEPGKGPVVGKTPERVVEIAERNGINYQRSEEKGLGLPKGFKGIDSEALIKLIEAVAFEW
ncbi:hypothetical protein [Thermococcus sp.]|uniref:hypothetical protein n=1 Tax=Thermococcus sp. TaxID=35749 RepID=UPI0025DA6579|nr:hypothetical protein [Thermococcus sp.]